MFYVYDQTGRVTQSASVSDPAGYRQVLDSHNLTYVESEEFTQEEITSLYVEDGVLKLRPVMDIQVEQLGFSLVLSNVPVGAELAVDGLPVGQVDDGVAELEIIEPGRYFITLTLEPYRLWTMMHEVSNAG